MLEEYPSFSAFYPYYLQEHTNRTCRRLHFVGSLLIILLLSFILVTAEWPLLWLLPFIGYGFAWIGHYFFEKNQPATFKYPIYSLMGDWIMFKDILIGKIPF